MNTAQIAASSIFLIMFFLIITEKIKRHYATLTCAALMIIIVFGIIMRSKMMIFKVLAVQNIFQSSFWFDTGKDLAETSGINWETIIFIAGMMMMVEYMAFSGFFHWICLKLVRFARYQPIKIFFLFIILSAVLAMFIDSITVIMFLGAITIEISQILELDPVPLIIAEMFCANLGGSATMSGDPPNIIIGTSLKYHFFDFLTNTGPIAALGMIIAIIYFYLLFRKKLKNHNLKPNINRESLEPKKAIKNKRDFIYSCILFTLAIIMLIMHGYLRVKVGTIGFGIGILSVILAGKNMTKLIKKIDVDTLLFFIGIFVVVGGLEVTGILEIIADFIGRLGSGNPYILIALLIFITAFASAFVDNIPFAATMIPIIKILSITQGIDIRTLSWTLAIGTDIGGCGTPIGASANIVGIAVAEGHGYHISWKEFCKISLPLMIMVIVASMLFIFLRYLH